MVSVKGVKGEDRPLDLVRALKVALEQNKRQVSALLPASRLQLVQANSLKKITETIRKASHKKSSGSILEKR